jgi:hypothetical protein
VLLDDREEASSVYHVRFGISVPTPRGSRVVYIYMGQTMPCRGVQERPERIPIWFGIRDRDSYGREIEIG